LETRNKDNNLRGFNILKSFAIPSHYLYLQFELPDVKIIQTKTNIVFGE